MTGPERDQLWVVLDQIAQDRSHLDNREHDAIVLARREDRSWEWIAEQLRYPSVEAVQERFQQLAARRVGIES